MKPLLVLALLAAVIRAPLCAAADELGRLFFTPQQRLELDRRRAANIQEATAVVQESTLTLQGQVSRSSGRTTTWINGMPMNDTHESPDPARVSIRPGEDEPKVELKVGETLDRVRGETRDNLGGGQLKVQKSPPSGR